MLTSLRWEDSCQSHVCMLITHLLGLWLSHLTEMVLTWEHCFVFNVFQLTDHPLSSSHPWETWALHVWVMGLRWCCTLIIQLMRVCITSVWQICFSWWNCLVTNCCFGPAGLLFCTLLAKDFIIPQLFQLTMNLFFLTQHPPPNLFHAFLNQIFFFFLLEKKVFFYFFSIFSF